MHQRLHVAVLKAQVMSTKTTTPGTDGNLILLDNCCNIQVSNQRSLLHDIVPNTDSTANTLGGGYKPTMKGNSLHIGCALYDPEAGVTVLSYKRMLDEGRVYHDEAEENFYLRSLAYQATSCSGSSGSKAYLQQTYDLWCIEYRSLSQQVK